MSAFSRGESLLDGNWEHRWAVRSYHGINHGIFASLFYNALINIDFISLQIIEWE